MLTFSGPFWDQWFEDVCSVISPGASNSVVASLIKKRRMASVRRYREPSIVQGRTNNVVSEPNAHVQRRQRGSRVYDVATQDSGDLQDLKVSDQFAERSSANARHGRGDIELAWLEAY